MAFGKRTKCFVGWWINPHGIRQRQWRGHLALEAGRGLPEGVGQYLCSLFEDGRRFQVMDLGRSQQGYSRVFMFVVIPVEERLAEGPGVLT